MRHEHGSRCGLSDLEAFRANLGEVAEIDIGRDPFFAEDSVPVPVDQRFAPGVPQPVEIRIVREKPNRPERHRQALRELALVQDDRAQRSVRIDLRALVGVVHLAMVDGAIVGLVAIVIQAQFVTELMAHDTPVHGIRIRNKTSVVPHHRTATKVRVAGGAAEHRVHDPAVAHWGEAIVEGFYHCIELIVRYRPGVNRVQRDAMTSIGVGDRHRRE